jgi:pre-mRNA-splicing factor 18
MDFASLMSKEISKAKPAAKAKAEESKKYLKRSEVEAERREKYLAEQRAIEAEKEAKIAQKRKREEEEAEANLAREEKRRKLAEESRRRREEQEAEEEKARRKRLGLPELIKETSEEVDADDIKDEELLEKLREMGQPAKLFGESHKQRLRRFRKLGVVMTTGPIPTSLELVEEKDMKVEKVPEDAEGKKFLFRQLASYFTMVLTEWESALEKEKRDTFASKAAYNAMVQSKENMTPVSHKSLATSFQELTYHSCFESLRRAMWTKGFWNPLWRLSKQLKNDDTWMLTMGIYV